MSYESEFTPVFLKLVGKLDKPTRERVLKAIDEVLTDPRRGSQLAYAREVLFKWRVGDYRIIYNINERKKVVTFIVVGHRRRIYKRYKF